MQVESPEVGPQHSDNDNSNDNNNDNNSNNNDSYCNEEERPMSENEKLTGGCLCGAIRLEVDRSAVVSANNCHCSDCQRSTGSAFATIVLIPDSAFELTSGEAKCFSVTGSSGKSVTRSFCPDCGSPLWSQVEVAPGLRFVKAGAFDDASWIEPASSYWGDSAQPWAPPVEGIPVHAQNPT